MQTTRRIFQSTLPARGATLTAAGIFYEKTISIHTPREGSDRGKEDDRYLWPISIHTPREGSDPIPSNFNFSVENFNPHSPRGERLVIICYLNKLYLFQSTLPARGATKKNFVFSCLLCISIHTPREGSDPIPSNFNFSVENFNPHSPRGERLVIICYLNKLYLFQSTLPARGATKKNFVFSCLLCISIHTPREGSDARWQRQHTCKVYFNPHSPRGERHRRVKVTVGKGYFNPHSPRGERLGINVWDSNGHIFQSTLPARGATLS